MEPVVANQNPQPGYPILSNSQTDNYRGVACLAEGVELWMGGLVDLLSLVRLDHSAATALAWAQVQDVGSNISQPGLTGLSLKSSKLLHQYKCKLTL